MRTIALIGHSGSGKSHRALLVSHEYKADIIIDDGLAIKGSRIIAGISAKKQHTKIGAIKTALFVSEEHAKQVKEAIIREKANKVLLLGTSQGMINKIVQRLGLPEPDKTIYISEIASEQEIYQAGLSRKKLGQHIIPAPTVAVKPKLSGLIIDPIKIFFTRSTPPSALHIEQTAVKPNFNYLGKFFITNSAMQDIIKHTVNKSDLPIRILKIDLNSVTEGIVINMEVSVKYNTEVIPKTMRQTQQIVLMQVEHMTALNVLAVNILVKGLNV